MTIPADSPSTSRSSSRAGNGGSSQAQGWLQGNSHVASLASVQASTLQQPTSLHLAGELGQEVGRVLGNGVRAGSLVLVGGGPGLGKSTLLMQLAALVATAPAWAAPAGTPLSQASDRVLYISGEESQEQLADRAERLQVVGGDKVDVLCENSMDAILEHLEALRPKAAIVDSVQTVSLEAVSGAQGSVAQVRECAKTLVSVCKQALGIPVFLVGHVTKGGDIAGPKTLEHIVDTVLYLEGEETSSCRVLRTTKNRFGSTDEVGLFELTRTGLAPLADPGAFLEERRAGSAARATGIVMEGNRPILIEVQALCSEVAKEIPPRRMVTGGLDFRRFDQVLAVLIKHGKVPLYNQDVRANVLGGAPALEPAVDAAMAAAVFVSFFEDAVLAQGMAFVGEIDLGGELRKVRAVEKRIAAAVNYGFSTVVVPPGSAATLPASLKQYVAECQDVRQLRQMMSSGDSKKASPTRAKPRRQKKSAEPAFARDSIA